MEKIPVIYWSGTGNTPLVVTDRDFVAFNLRMGF